MKLNHRSTAYEGTFSRFSIHLATEIANFGNARLVKTLNGKFELLGGSPDDRAAAREWCSLFLHDAVFACSPAHPPRPATPMARHQKCLGT
jgi:hypothetical protein